VFYIITEDLLGINWCLGYVSHESFLDLFVPWRWNRSMEICNHSK